VLLAAALLAAGCGTPEYLVRAGWAEARLLWRREPIADLLARPDLDPHLRERLLLVLRVRDFAGRDLGLDTGDSFTTYARTGDTLVWVLAAARRDRLEAHTWWYPIVGRVPYKGFFERPDAEAAAAALDRRGLDTDVRRASAFSTLGWFADPLSSSTAAEPPVQLAETVIHELFHVTCYVPGASAFNESAANFVGHRGAAAFFCRAGDVDACADAHRRWTDERRRSRVLARLAAGLRALYARRPTPPARDRGRLWLSRAAARTLAAEGDQGASELLPPNNARLLGELVYLTDLDRLDALAPTDAALRDAVALLVRAGGDGSDPFAATWALAALQTR
jgi:predicted aminopeptidase